MAKTTTAVAKRRNPAKKKRRRRGGFTLPLAVIGGFAPLVVHGVRAFQAGGLPNMGTQLALRTTGYNYADNGFYPGELVKGVGPIVLGTLVHKFIGGTLGINRALALAKIPLLRL